MPVIYFTRKNDSLLRLVNILYNFQLMKPAGENGVAAYGIIMYVNFVFMAIFFGYAIGCAPVIGYHYDAGLFAMIYGAWGRCGVRSHFFPEDAGIPDCGCSYFTGFSGN